MPDRKRKGAVVLDKVEEEIQARCCILTDALIQREQVQSILRISKQDKICNNSIATHLEIDVDAVEAACFKPAHLHTNAYMLYTSELRRTEPRLFMNQSLITQRAVLEGKWAAVSEMEKQSLKKESASLKSTAQSTLKRWEIALEHCLEHNAVKKSKLDEAAAKEKCVVAEEVLSWKEQKIQAAKQRPAGKKRVPTSTEKTLQEHNAAIKTAIAMRKDRKAHFIAKHWDVIAPFVAYGMKKPRVVASDLRPILKLPLTSQPKCITGVTMRDYQLTGLNYLLSMYEAGMSTILGDEMGLGKTLQTISLLSYLKYEANVSGPHLIIVPLSVFSNWIAEFKRFCPGMRVVQVHSSDEAERLRLRKTVLSEVANYDVAVTTYEMAKSPAMQNALVSRLYWRYVILDEGHMIKNEETIIAQTVRSMHCEAKIVITGTPLQNNLHEFWSILNYLEPDLFNASDAFDDAFDISGTEHSVDKGLLGKAHSLAKVMMIRRTKGVVEKSIPPKVEKRVVCPLSPMQTLWYKRLLLKDRDILYDIDFDGVDEAGTKGSSAVKSSAPSAKGATMLPHLKKDFKRLAMLLAQLRKVCNHPFLINGAEEEAGTVGADGEFLTNELLVSSSGKLNVLDRLLVRLKSAGHRVVIFSQFTKTLDILEDYMGMRFGEKSYRRLDGSVNRVQRTIDIRFFNTERSPIFAFLMSTRAGGLGVNLQTADTVILFDSDWNPQADMQAMARVHRIGQRKVVHVYRLVSGGTVEERIVQRAEKKIFLDQMVNRDGLDEETKDDAPQTGSELLSLLKFGAHAIIRSQGETMSDAEVDSLIKRQCAGDSKEQGSGSDGSNGGEDRALQEQVDCQFTVADFDAEVVPVSARSFGGKFYGKKGEGAYVGDMADFDGHDGARKRESRLVKQGSDMVLKRNMYTMEAGEPSVMDLEAAGLREHMAEMAEEKKKRSTMQRAGRDYDHMDVCLVCWDGGALTCCDICPASYHLSCIGLTEKDLPQKGLWTCPQHRCACGRSAAASGGLLFRCAACPQSFCEEHLPEAATIVETNSLFESLGCRQQRSACFVECSSGCTNFLAGQRGEAAPPSVENEVIDVSEKDVIEVIDVLSSDEEGEKVEEDASLSAVPSAVSEEKRILSLDQQKCEQNNAAFAFLQRHASKSGSQCVQVDSGGLPAGTKRRTDEEEDPEIAVIAGTNSSAQLSCLAFRPPSATTNGMKRKRSEGDKSKVSPKASPRSHSKRQVGGAEVRR